MSGLPAMLFKYVGLEGAINILRDRRLRFTSAKSLDDPLELLLERFSPPPPDLVRPVLERRLRGIVGGAAEPIFAIELGGADAIRAMREGVRGGIALDRMVDTFVKTAVSPDALRTKVHEPLQAELAKTRICSMSETPDCPALWSHFGCGFRGAVVGFLPTLEFPAAGRSTAERVSYSSIPDELRAVGLEEWVDYLLDQGIPDPVRAVHRALLTKPGRYSGQREWRHTIRTDVDPDEPLDAPIDPSGIKAVMLGQRVDADQTAEVVRLAQQLPTPVAVRRVRASWESPDSVIVEAVWEP